MTAADRINNGVIAMLANLNMLAHLEDDHIMVVGRAELPAPTDAGFLDALTALVAPRGAAAVAAAIAAVA